MDLPFPKSDPWPGLGLNDATECSLEQTARLVALAQSYQRVCVVGLGYVGLPTALLFALNGLSVHGVDISPKVLENLAQSRVGEVYPELRAWWNEVQASGRFTASAQPQPADVFLITVPTPVHEHRKSCDLSMVRAATESILTLLRPSNLVVLESTVPPGTTRKLIQTLIESHTSLTLGEDLFLCFSPERVLPGSTTTEELVQNDRVIGGINPASAEVGKALFSRVMQGQLYTTNDVTAEFCKLAENTYRDVNIALANELSILADEYGVEMSEARELINMHPRVNLLKPGIGVGGHCIAVDPWFFVEASPMNTRLISISRQVNDRMPEYTAQKILLDVGDIEDPRICLVGLTYKPDVGDVRESPALRVVSILVGKDMEIVPYDPLLEVYQGQTLLEVARDADYLGVLVCHTVVMETLNRQRAEIEAVMRHPRIRIF
jgi:UDP-N-acetyl-D-mannosaminuronic acid dehydrogenase